MRDPILASKTFAPGAFHGNRVPMVFRVEGGLHYFRGNSAPYFSLTYWAHRKGFPEQCQEGGAGHDEILRHFPQFADLAEMHLSDMDGVPMHAEANGWYQLAGALGGWGEEYHAGNSRGHYGGEYREPTADECLETFARHCRIPLYSAREIKARVLAYADTIVGEGRGNPREEWRRIMETMRPRWKAEAEECIARHGLRVYGDPWPPETGA